MVARHGVRMQLGAAQILGGPRSHNSPPPLSTRLSAAWPGLIFYLYRKMLWVDRYRPISLEKLDFHKDQAAQLRELVRGRSGSWSPPRVVTWVALPVLATCRPSQASSRTSFSMDRREPGRKPG